MAFGLNLRAINGVCNAQSHRHTKRKTLLKMKGQKMALSAQGTQSVKHAKHTQSEQR